MITFRRPREFLFARTRSKEKQRINKSLKEILFYLKKGKESQFSIAALFFNGALAAKEYGTRTIILPEGKG